MKQKNKNQSEFFKAMTNTLFGSAARMCSRTHYYILTFCRPRKQSFENCGEKKQKSVGVHQSISLPSY